MASGFKTHSKNCQAVSNGTSGQKQIRKKRLSTNFFRGLQPFLLSVCASPFQQFQDLKILDHERCNHLVDINRIHTALNQIRKYMAQHDKKRRTQTHQVQYARTHIPPPNIEVGGNDLIRTHARKERINGKHDGAVRCA